MPKGIVKKCPLIKAKCMREECEFYEPFVSKDGDKVTHFHKCSVPMLAVLLTDVGNMLRASVEATNGVSANLEKGRAESLALAPAIVKDMMVGMISIAQQNSQKRLNGE